MNSLVYSLFIVKNFYNEVSLVFQDKCSKDYSFPIKFDLVNSV